MQLLTVLCYSYSYDIFYNMNCSLRVRAPPSLEQKTLGEHLLRTKH